MRRPRFRNAMGRKEGVRGGRGLALRPKAAKSRGRGVKEMTALLRWLGRKAALFLILVVAVAFFSLVWPNLSADLKSPGQVKQELAQARDDAQQGLTARAGAMRGASEAALAERLATAKALLAEAERQQRAAGGLFDRFRPSKILERKRLELRISALALEIEAIEQMQAEHSARRAWQMAQQGAMRRSSVPTEAAIRQAAARCIAARNALRGFNERQPPDRIWRDIVGGERRRLQQSEQAACAAAGAALQRRRDGLEAQRQARAARQRYERARGWTVGRVEDVSRAVEETVLRDILRTAALFFVLILAMPLLIRLLFYFVLAPIAERRPAIRLFPRDSAPAPVPAAPRSQTSVSVRLGDGEELLVRQGFLQATSETGTKETQWLLDWRHPLSSTASGLTFLTRIRGTGARTTVSAVRDPFAEVTMVELPAGASCVLHPRALAAVVQHVGRPLRITSHWRLASLHAWLTLQLRYIVFHGPARLVIKGSRGVRVEQAERGRIFGPEQLVGFSSDLAYSVRRTETFWPYFLGREPLLKDRVEEGRGVLMVEEAPLAGRRAGVRKGLEGALDAGLKAFGL